MLSYFAFTVILSCFCTEIHGNAVHYVYYVVPTNQNGSNCHSLNYYAENKEHYFLTNSTFIFFPGEHKLGYNLTVTNVSSIKLLLAESTQYCGQVVQDSNLTIVNCNGHSAGFMFSNVYDLEIHGINFTECGQIYLNKTSNMSKIYTYIDVWRAALILHMVTNFKMINVSITKSNGYGLLGDHVFNSSIEHCLLEENKGYKNYSSPNTTVEVHGGNIEMYYNTSCKNSLSYFDISRTIIREGASVSFASGLDLILKCSNGGIMFRLNEVQLLNNRGYTDRDNYHEGGNFGLQILISQNATNSVSFVDCSIENGYSFIGSGMYVALYIHSHILDPHNALEIESTKFFNNTAKIGAGMHMRLYHSGKQCKSFVKITLNNCHFEENQLDTNRVRMSGGIAVHVISFKVPGDMLHSTPQYKTSFTNCTFKNNVIWNHTSVGSGTLYFEEHSNVVLQNCTISDNNSTGITAVHSNIRFIGKNTIKRNTAIYGGGMLLSDHATIFLSEDSSLHVSDNNATEAGGGIYAEFGFTYAIPICFFQFNVSSLLNRTNRKSSKYVHLHNNNASTGTAVYGGQIDNCYFLVDNKPWIIKELSHLHSGEIFDDTFNYTSTATKTAISSDPLDVCFCEKNAPPCNKSQIKKISPGETFNVMAFVVGQRNGNVSGNVVADFYSQNKSMYNINSNETIQQVKMSCTTLTYTLHSRMENIPVNLSLRVSESANLNTFLQINITDCPIGFRLNSTKMKCECVRRLLDRGIICHAEDHTIQRPANFWIGYNMGNNKNISYHYTDQVVAYKNCPRLYCIPHETKIKALENHIEQDHQCYLEREDILCGRCRHGLSIVFGTPRCKSCQYFSKWATFGVLCICALAGVALVAFLLVCNLTVTEGTINGFIFYGNLIQANQNIYFVLGSTVKSDGIFYTSMRIFIAWLNLDLGFELCFFDGMDTFNKTWLQFLFPVYIWCIAGVLIWLSRKYSYMTRLMKNNGTKVLATLILLSYTKLARAVMTSLSGATLSTHDHSYTHTVWYFDGSIQYFQGRHIFLFLTAVLFAIVFLPFTLMLLFIKHLPRFSSLWIFSWVNKLKPFFDAYTGPYTDEFRFWMGFQLLTRISLLFCTGLHTSDILILLEIVGVCALLLSVNFFYGTRIYKKRSLNCLEAYLLLNLIFWSLTIAYYTHHEVNTKQNIFPGITFLVFCGVICYHLYKLYLRRLYTRSHGKLRRCFNKISITIMKCKRKFIYVPMSHTGEEAEEIRSEQSHLLRNAAVPVTICQLSDTLDTRRED